MSYSWTSTGTGFDEEPRDVHPLTCAVWDTNDPCSCGAAEHEVGVQQWIAKFDAHATQGRAS